MMILLINSSSSGNPLVFFVLIFLVFWFFMIRPQVKKQKQEKKFRENLKKSDSIVTTGGICGKVSNVSENHIILDVGEGVKLKIKKTAISLELSPNNDNQKK